MNASRRAERHAILKVRGGALWVPMVILLAMFVVGLLDFRPGWGINVAVAIFLGPPLVCGIAAVVVKKTLVVDSENRTLKIGKRSLRHLLTSWKEFRAEAIEGLRLKENRTVVMQLDRRKEVELWQFSTPTEAQLFEQKLSELLGLSETAVESRNVADEPGGEDKLVVGRSDLPLGVILLGVSCAFALMIAHWGSSPVTTADFIRRVLWFCLPGYMAVVSASSLMRKTTVVFRRPSREMMVYERRLLNVRPAPSIYSWGEVEAVQLQKHGTSDKGASGTVSILVSGISPRVFSESCNYSKAAALAKKIADFLSIEVTEILPKQARKRRERKLGTGELT